MKRTNLFIAAILILVSTLANAQSKTGFGYFGGKWIANGPTGDVHMVIGFEKNLEKVTCTIKDTTGRELFKVEETTVEENKVIIIFTGSQGSVDMVLNKRDEDHLAGSIMGGMASVAGERMKEKK